MEKNELFLFDAQSAVGQALIRESPRGSRIHAWTDRAVYTCGMPMPRHVDLQCVSLDQAVSLVSEASAASHVVMTTDRIFRGGNAGELRQWVEVVKRCYDACCQGRTRVFVFISTVGVCEKESLPSAKKMRQGLVPEEVRLAYEIESYLVASSSQRSLKPVVLRLGEPYGGSSCFGVFEIFQMMSILAMTGLGVPRFSAAGVPLVHVDEAARAILFLLARGDAEGGIFNFAEKDCLSRNTLFELASGVSEASGRQTASGHARLWEWAWKVASRCGMSASFGACVGRLWRQVCHSYGLYPCPPPDLAWFFAKTGSVRIQGRRWEKLGYVRTCPAFRECVQAVYDGYCHRQFLPQLKASVPRPESLVNRLAFEQQWVGQAVDTLDGMSSVPVALLFHTEMPLWKSRCFGEPRMFGAFVMESRLKTAVGWKRPGLAWHDIFSLKDVAFDFTMGGRYYRFCASSAGPRLWPHADFVISDADGTTRYTGSLRLDCSPAAVMAFLSSLAFVR